MTAFLAVLVTICPPLAWAKAEVVAPPGWWVSSGAAPEAQRRASEWKAALDLPIAQVMSSPYDDRFRETIATFTLPEPISAEAFADEASAYALLRTSAAGLIGEREAVASGLRETSSGATVVWGRWTIDKISYDCVLAPAGADATLLVMAVRADALADHRDLLDGVVRELEGVTAPLPKFSLWSWRIGSILIWLCFALGLHALMLRFSDTEGDHNQAGRRAAMITFGLVLVGAVVTYLGLAEHEFALEHAGSSRDALTIWVTVAGICVAGLHFLFAARLDRGFVQSAPASGVYATSGQAASSYIHASLSQSMKMAELSQTAMARPRPEQPPSDDPAKPESPL